MPGSDWPVSTRYMTYRQTLEIVRRHPGVTLLRAEENSGPYRLVQQVIDAGRALVSLSILGAGEPDLEAVQRQLRGVGDDAIEQFLEVSRISAPQALAARRADQLQSHRQSRRGESRRKRNHRARRHRDGAGHTA